MNTLQTSISADHKLWGYTDILENDLEQMQFATVFAPTFDVPAFGDEAVLHSVMNFSEEDEDFQEEPVESDEAENDGPFADRESYRNTDLDNVYYLI